MSFYINLYVPTQGKNVKVKELSFEHYKTINKFLINNNNQHIADYFDVILKDCLVDSDDFIHFTSFDKFCALLLLRCICVSPDIEFKNGAINSKASILPFLQKCIDFKMDFTQTITVDNLDIQLTLPKILNFETVFDVLHDSISKVFFNKKEIVYPPNKDDLLEMLPAEIMTHLKNFSDKTTENFKALILDIGVQQDTKITLSPYNLSLLEILKALFTANLKSIIELQYVLVSKISYSPEYIDKNTLAENLVLVNIYETEMKSLKEEQTKGLENPLAVNK